MRMWLETEIDLDEPTADAGFVTWFQVKLGTKDEDGALAEDIGWARVAVIHVGVAGGELCEALDADSSNLETLYGLYFNDDWLKEEYAQGVGSEVIYFDDIHLEPSWQNRGIELAVVRRLCDTLGQGSDLAVVCFQKPEEAESWARMGFELTCQPESGGWGYMHLRMSLRHPLVRRTDDEHGFRVVPNPNPDERARQH